MKDALNNPVSGVTVNLVAPGMGPSAALGASSAVTNSLGVVSVSATANGTPGGPYNVTASAAGVTSVNFLLTNMPQSLSGTCSAMNTGTVNVLFNSGPESVTGGVQPYTFYLGGSVPLGLTVAPSTGAVSGTPSTSRSFSIYVKDVSNTVGATP